MTLEPLHPIQLRRFREMTFAEKWAVARGLWKIAWEAIVRAMHRLHSHLSDEVCRQMAAREIARARTII
jgi:hypothetical protein